MNREEQGNTLQGPLLPFLHQEQGERTKEEQDNAVQGPLSPFLHQEQGGRKREEQEYREPCVYQEHRAKEEEGAHTVQSRSRITHILNCYVNEFKPDEIC
jgi:hypothetical protein